MNKVMTIGELAFNYDNIMRIPGLGDKQHRDGPLAKGFSIGKGKTIYWWITPQPRSNTYRVIQQGFEFKKVSVRYGIPSNQLVTIHY